MSNFNIKERGEALDSSDLMLKLKTFLQNNTSFSIIRDGSLQTQIVEGITEPNPDNWYVFQNEGYFYNFKSFYNEAPFSQSNQTHDNSWGNINETRNQGICLNISSSFSLSNEWDRQNGYYQDGAPILKTSEEIIEYDFFYNGSIVYVICQYNNLSFSHLCFGAMNSFKGENIPFCSGNFYHQFDSLTINQKELVNFYNSGVEDGQNIMFKNGIAQKFSGNINTNSYITENEVSGIPLYSMPELKRSKNVFSGKHTLVKGMFFDNRKYKKIENNFYPTEYIEGINFVYFETFFEKEELTIGVNKYIAYPFTTKTNPFNDNDVSSSGLGILIKVDNYFT